MQNLKKAGLVFLVGLSGIVGSAIGFVNVDNAPTPELIQEHQALENKLDGQIRIRDILDGPTVIDEYSLMKIRYKEISANPLFNEITQQYTLEQKRYQKIISIWEAGIMGSYLVMMAGVYKLMKELGVL